MGAQKPPPGAGLPGPGGVSRRALSALIRLAGSVQGLENVTVLPRGRRRLSRRVRCRAHLA